MPNLAIRCENLSKQYRIGSRERYQTLRDAISNTARATFRRFKNPSQSGNGYIWALNDVSFEIKRGEVVGIIGLNGAGKSTLLKILSRITAPTRGTAKIHGRVGSLLEVGTGFHLELTGRENIYLNGAILGMRKAVIIEKGVVVAQGEINQTVDRYLSRINSAQSSDAVVETNTFSVKSVQVSSVAGPVIKTFDPVQLRVQFVPRVEIKDPGLYVSFLTMDSRRLTGLDLKDFITAAPLPAGQPAELGFTIESLPLLPGTYQVEIHLKDMARRLIEFVPRTFEIEV